jgi:hypothetical protein
VNPKPVVDQAKWLSTGNRAAQRALRSMGMIEPDPASADAGAPQSARESLALSVAKRAPQLTPGSSPGTLSPSADGADLQTTFPGVAPPMYAAMDISQAKHFYEQPKVEEPWSLGVDLDKYRAYSVREGSRDVGQSLGKALERIGLTIEDTTNVITLGYASERGAPFRSNDGKGFLDDPARVPWRMGETILNLGDGLYSLADLVTLDSLPNQEKNIYSDNHPIVRPLLFTGRTIGGVFITVGEIGNALTWGYFDNVAGSIGMCIEDIIEVLKHTGQAVTNVARVPVQLISGNDSEADKALDWVLLVPLEMASNVVEMQGIGNTYDYETAFADKGVIGSMLEFGGSSYIVYRAVDELLDDLDDDDHSHRKAGDSSGSGSSDPPDIPEDPTPPDGTNYYWWFDENGNWVFITD